MGQEEHIIQLMKRLDEVEAEINEINKKLDMQKGFIGGVVFVVSSIWAFLVAFKSYFFGIK